MLSFLQGAAVVGTAVAVYIVALALLGMALAALPGGGIVGTLVPLALALVAGTVLWGRREEVFSPRTLAGSVVLGAAGLGTVGFLGGFLGPMVLAPGANQGPLLGIFITGPAGAVLGAVGGAVVWSLRGDRRRRTRRGTG